MNKPFTLRPATLEDIPQMERLIADSARGLGTSDYTEAQVEAALRRAWGIDTELIRDGTYFAAVSDGQIVGCGGWSFRRTLFGGDKQGGRRSERLNPAQDAARIRAFFVHPNWARQGIGRALLERCETEARASGFQSAALMATLPGQRLYRALGYVGEQRVSHDLGGESLDFVPMTKDLSV